MTGFFWPWACGIVISDSPPTILAGVLTVAGKRSSAFATSGLNLRTPMWIITIITTAFRLLIARAHSHTGAPGSDPYLCESRTWALILVPVAYLFLNRFNNISEALAKFTISCCPTVYLVIQHSVLRQSIYPHHPSLCP